MKKFLDVFYRLLAVAVIICAVWFGIGSWMRSQPSDILYWVGTLLDILIIVPIAFLMKPIFKKLLKKLKE